MVTRRTSVIEQLHTLSDRERCCSGVYPNATLARIPVPCGSGVPVDPFATDVCEGLDVVQHKTQTVAYVRVSSTDQNLDRQREAIGDVDRVFEEKVSGGSRTDRAALLDCIRYIRDGDTVRVASMDRLARSLGDLRDIVDEITAKGASVEFVKEQQTYSRDTDDAIGRLMLNLLGAFAEFERTLIRERQREGIRLARTAGKYKGRTRKLTDDQIADARLRVSKGIPKAVVARELGIDRTTLYRMLATRLSPIAAPAPDGEAAEL
ncbi:recombinase family protein [Curtobacterium sp. MCBD17_030]|uniref:recombinase family protein n=1 Tax=Curtobacterium sp. MCBD17_030 TaxID=2175649 RepID=UPI0035CCDE79